jgi:hypothetical protein
VTIGWQGPKFKIFCPERSGPGAPDPPGRVGSAGVVGSVGVVGLAGGVAGRNETGLPLRQDALDPGFHCVPAGPAYLDRGADGAGVT